MSLNLGNLNTSGLSKLQEIGAALRDFRSAGKRVVVAADSLDQSQYYLAAQAGEVYLDPMGLVYVDGFSYYRMFLKEAIDKLGVDVNIFRAGTFKSFTDQFSRSDMAPSEREESSVWLEALWNAYQQDVTRARSLPANALSEYVSEAPAALAAVNGDAAKLALQRGLVTALKSRRQVADDLKSIVGEDQDSHSFNSIGMTQYLAAVRSKRVLKSKSDARVGIVVASGEILDGHQPPGMIGGESTADLLRQARYENTVKAVVLRVDSPGGSMFASEQILREVQALRKAGKPVVVSMSTYAASGGYYISAAANQIFASPTTLTGSIGVFSVVPTFQHTLEKLGVKVDGIGTTPLAGEMRLDRTLGSAGRQILQSSVEHAYAEFLRRVGEGRKKSVEDVDKIAQGRVWAGVDAQRIGLVDHLGGLKDATDAAAKLAELGSDYGVDYIESELSLREELLMQLRSEVLRLGQAAGLITPRSEVRARVGPAACASACDRTPQRSARAVCVLLVHGTVALAASALRELDPGLDAGPLGRRQGRPVLVPPRGLFKGSGELQHTLFRPGRPGDLQTDRQPATGHAAGNRDRRNSKHVEGACVAQDRSRLECKDPVEGRGVLR